MNELSHALVQKHLSELDDALEDLGRHPDLLNRWGVRLAWALTHSGKLLTAGNGCSAAHAQLLAAEIVGRVRDEREALPAIALSADTAVVTGLGDDFGYEEVFARQVEAHGQEGDILILLSTGGASANVLAAAKAARERGVEIWALTGGEPSPLAALADEHFAVSAASDQVVLEVHQILIHLLCECFELVLPRARDEEPQV